MGLACVFYRSSAGYSFPLFTLPKILANPNYAGYRATCRTHLVDILWFSLEGNEIFSMLYLELH
uniref:Uncharacterized protein n=1 Tax=Arion vulgaris TaxID=1028688 RepID=A0A0B7BBY6_9EUPU